MKGMWIPTVFILFLTILAVYPLFKKKKDNWCAEQVRDYYRVRRWSKGALIFLTLMYIFLWIAKEIIYK